MRPALLIIVSCCLVFYNSLENSFHYDDEHSITDNFHIRDINNIFSYFFSTKAFSNDSTKSMYRPILLVTYALNYAVDGYDVVGYHIVNTALHAANSLSLRAIVLSLGYTSPAAFLSGILFAIHPLITEPVNYISSRSDSLASFFLFIAFLLYVKWRVTCRKLFFFSTLTSFLFAIMSKSSAISLLIIIPAYDLIYRYSYQVHSWYKGALKRYAGLLLVAIFYVILIISNGFLGSSLRSPVRSGLDQFTTQVKAFVFYVYNAWFPYSLNVEHQFFTGALHQSSFWSGICLIISVIFILWKFCLCKFRSPVFFSIWSIASLLPVMIMPLNVLVNERRLYIATAGFCASLAILFWYLNNKRRLLILSSIVLLIYALLTVQRNNIWRDDLSLWSDSSDKAPLMPRPFLYLGNTYKDKALALPTNSPMRELHWEQSIHSYRNAIKYDRSNGVISLRALNNLGAVCFATGKISDAEAAYRKAVSIDPNYADALINLGTIYHYNGRKEKDIVGAKLLIDNAIDYYERALKLLPNHSDAWSNLGLAYSDLNNYNQAKKAYDQALFLDPNNPKLLGNIGKYYVTIGNMLLGQEALEYFLKAQQYLAKSVQIDPYNDENRSNLDVIEKALSKWK